MGDRLEERIWWNYIHDDLKDLLSESILLVKRVGDWQEKFSDYAFVVFPAAKAYEGFLKTLFLDLGFIGEDDYYGRHFRIGKALNPSMENHLREKESVYDRLVDFCKGDELPDKLWQTWKRGRNLRFHWFPDEKNAVSLTDAEDIINEILNTMDFAFRECKMDR